MQLRSFAFFTFLFTAIVTQAQPVYRIVGPDGRVSYSDQPPDSQAAGKAKALDGLNGKPQVAGPAAKTDPDLDPVLAATQVYRKEVEVELSRILCGNLAAEWPAVAGSKEVAAAVSEARTKWYERHATLIQKRKRILNDSLPRAGLEKMADEAKADIDPRFKRLEKAPSAERLQWCRGVPASFDSYDFDLIRHGTLVDTLAGTRKGP